MEWGKVIECGLVIVGVAATGCGKHAQMDAQTMTFGKICTAKGANSRKSTPPVLVRSSFYVRVYFVTEVRLYLKDTQNDRIQCIYFFKCQQHNFEDKNPRNHSQCPTPTLCMRSNLPVHFQLVAGQGHAIVVRKNPHERVEVRVQDQAVCG